MITWSTCLHSSGYTVDCLSSCNADIVDDVVDDNVDDDVVDDVIDDVTDDVSDDDVSDDDVIPLADCNDISGVSASTITSFIITSWHLPLLLTDGFGFYIYKIYTILIN